MSYFRVLARADVFSGGVFMKQGKTMEMGELVKLYLLQTGLMGPFKEREACRLWPEVVGRLVASRTTRVWMEKGVMRVRFSSAVVRQEVALVKEGVMEALNERLGGRVVRDIVLY